MTNCPYEFDMPSMTKLKVMEDEAMGLTSPIGPKKLESSQRHDASESDGRFADGSSTKREGVSRRCGGGDDARHSISSHPGAKGGVKDAAGLNDVLGTAKGDLLSMFDGSRFMTFNDDEVKKGTLRCQHGGFDT
ncbi:hypothetical protein CERZMDRAFT_92471 [Cercospora zeae-maydis SCOH1-5]|uniref:Uncharacterized protein n=1 Tax=Cercospora zeae-maydis SCOH1-5 TaxID=717836 RepID=A0A6A6FX96_9PEZI|nr:hypothetical protein CERZMDRAFT_92471 [Cercospora zeae-maydis SCOH1-5]